jgi:hypothetical protein
MDAQRGPRCGTVRRSLVKQRSDERLSWMVDRRRQREREARGALQDSPTFAPTLTVPVTKRESDGAERDDAPCRPGDEPAPEPAGGPGQVQGGGDDGGGRHRRLHGGVPGGRPVEVLLAAGRPAGVDRPGHQVGQDGGDPGAQRQVAGDGQPAPDERGDQEGQPPPHQQPYGHLPQPGEQVGERGDDPVDRAEDRRQGRLGQAQAEQPDLGEHDGKDVGGPPCPGCVGRAGKAAGTSHRLSLAYGAGAAVPIGR